jgi:hypothetical protein
MPTTATSRLVEIITAAEPEVRNRSVEAFCRRAELTELLAECDGLERLRHASGNLYERVRALFFLYAIHRFHVPEKLSGAESPASAALIPYDGYQHFLNRRFEESIERFLAAQQEHGPSDAISSALAAAYRDLGLQTLANQVRRSVRGLRGNQWMFRVGHPADHALRIRPELLAQPAAGAGGAGMYPVLRESTSSFSAWIIPREPACSTCRSTSPCMAAMRHRSRPSKPICG